MTIEDITHHHGTLRSFDVIALALVGGKTCMKALHSHSSQRGLCTIHWKPLWQAIVVIPQLWYQGGFALVMYPRYPLYFQLTLSNYIFVNG